MFTIILLLLVLAGVLLRLLSNLLVRPAQFPADSPNIQIPTSPTPKLGNEKHDKVSAAASAVKDSESFMRGHQHSPSSSNIQIPTTPSTKSGSEEHDKVSAADFTDTKTSSPPSNVQMPTFPSTPKFGSEEHDKVSSADSTDTKNSPPSSSSIQMPTSPSTPKFGSEEHDKVSSAESTNTKNSSHSSSSIQMPTSPSTSKFGSEEHDKVSFAHFTDTKESSPSSSVSKLEHEVFLSFRGEDTRNGFTDHLYRALNQKGINTFRDTEKLKRGNSISTDLLTAIEESQIAVIILSANYASSTWCLNELAHIVDCQSTGLEIFPVFYHVDTSEVRKQTGNFGEAFCKHEKDFKDNMEKVNKWREALTQVASISGWDVKGRAESEVIREIAKRIWTEVNNVNNTCSSDWKDLVGMKARMETMESYLDLGSDDVRTVGIWGMGGIGKTTLAKAVFDKIQSEFDCSAFVGEVRDVCSKVSNAIVDLQKLLCKTLQLDSDANIQHAAMGVRLFRKRLGHKKVLIILDDVDNKEHIDSLAAEGWLGSGSRVIITTRDKQTLMACGVAEDKTYEVERLTDNESIRLFCQNAFEKKHAPPDEYKDLSNNFVKCADGLPLALKVLGSALCGGKVDEWSDALASLDANPNPGIFGVLQLSYDGLKENEREIFLDIACFFRGENEYRVKKILDGCGFSPISGIPVLIKKSLIKVEGNNLWMHDLVQQMGWHIVRRESPQKPGKRSRLWLNEKKSHEYEHSSTWLDEDARDVVTENLGTNLVQGLYLSTLAKEEDIPLKAGDPFKNMRMLRLLKICNVNLLLDVQFENLSNKLRVLEWHGYPLESLPSSFQPDKLVELKMPNSRIEKLWNETLCLEKLILMDLSYCQCLIKTPNFSTVPKLEELILEGCANLSDVHPTVWGLQNLKVANFKYCKSLESLPKSISLKSLETLNLWGCLKLNEFPEIVGNMVTLSELYLCRTAIRELPTTIQCLSGLILLDLRGCKNLVGLPSVICSLTSLKFLLLSHCSLLDQLPEDIGRLENLEELDACHTAVRKVPSSIVHLKNLKSLCFHGCRQGPRGLQLPRSFSGLNSLQSLFLGQCDLAQGEIPEDIGCLSSLQRLRMDENNFESIPESISQLSTLKELRVARCSKLQSLPKHHRPSLEVDASDCPLLTNYRKQLNISLSDEGIGLINCENSKETAGTRYPLPIPEEQIEQFFPKCIEDRIILQQMLYVRFHQGEIPHWCRHKSRGSSVAMHVSDHEVDKSLGLALFFVFEILEIDNFDESWELQQTFCTLKDDQGVAYQIDTAVTANFEEFWLGTLVVCCYVPLVYIQSAGMLDKASRIEASVSTMSPDLEVKECGMHLIFQQEAAKFAQDLCEACNPNTDFEFGRHCKELINVKEKESSCKEMVPNEAEKVSWEFDFNIHSGENLQLLLSLLYEGPYGREKDFGLVFPHKVIPFWFFHHYAGDVALCDFPQDLFDDQRWAGLELFVMVSSGYSINVECLLDVHLCSNESSTISTSVFINTSLGSDQIVVIHIPRVRFSEQLNQCQGISALFRMTTPDMVVRMCGSRLLYEQDLEDLIRAITVCTLDSEVVVDSLCQHIGQLLGSYLPEEPFDLVVETVEQNSVGGENDVGRKNDYSSSEREDLIQHRGELLNFTTKQPQVFTSILHNYRSYLQQKHGFIESEKIIAHPEPFFLSFLDDGDQVKDCCAQKDPNPVFATHHLHVMAETPLYGSLSPEDWKRSLELLLECFKVATLSVKGQVIAVLNPFTPSSVNNFCFPRKELLGWFRGAGQTSFPRIEFPISPHALDDENWRGLAICAAFSVHEHASAVLDNLGTGTFNVMCHLSSNGQCLSPAPVFSITKEKFKWLHLGGFIWLTYIPRSYLTEFKVVSDAEARIYTDCPGLMMTKWSIRPLFKQDVKEFNQAIVQCWTSFFDNLDFVRQFVEADENEQSHYTDRAETSEMLMPKGDVKDFNRDFIYNATFPQYCTQLMEWFGHHQSRDHSVEIQLPPCLSSDGNWIGLALCARFSDLENRTTSIDKVNPEIPKLVCHLETEKSSLEDLHHYRPTNEEFKWLCPTGFIWLSYIPRQWFQDQLNECDLLEASFASENRGLFAEMCGLRLVYQHDEQEFKHHISMMNSLLDNEKSERLEEHEAPEKGKQVLEYPKPTNGSEGYESNWYLRIHRFGH